MTLDLTLQRGTASHGFVCECNGRCRQRLYLPPFIYHELAAEGTVLHPQCAIREGRTVLRRFGAKAVVCLTAPKARTA